MEGSSDVEEIIPPTPKLHQNSAGLRSRIFVSGKSTLKSCGDMNKNDAKNVKRKKISGVSPEFKKIKHKAKQVTLYNFFSKSAQEYKHSSDVNHSSSDSARVNLINRIENSDLIQNKMKTESENKENSRSLDQGIASSLEKCIEKSHVLDHKFCAEVESLTLSSEYEENIHAADNTTAQKGSYCGIINNENIHNGEIGPLASKDNLQGSVLEYTLCTENIDVKNSRVISPYVFSQSFKADRLDNSVLKFGHEPNVEVTSSSFSWMNDIDWKTEDSSMKSENLVFESSNAGQSHSVSCKLCDGNTKYIIQQVNKNDAINEIELVLKGLNCNCSSPRMCLLKGFWAQSLVFAGDTVHVLKPFENNLAVIEDDSGFLVINPDLLLSSTSVVSTLFCMRKAALNHVIPSWASGNTIMMVGSLIHDVFQKAVSNHANSKEQIEEIIENVFKKKENLLSLCSENISEKDIKEKLYKYVPSIYDWINRHCSFKGLKASENIIITDVQDVEDNVWCPKYGVKGKIDMTVTAFFKDQKISKLMPLELKTGRPTFSAEHVGQVNLYSLMMEERTKKVSDGLLLYLRDGVNMKMFKDNHNSRRGLIQLRNELSFYIHKWYSSKYEKNEEIEDCRLPQPINSKRMCEKCPYLLPCTVYQRAYPDHQNLESAHAMFTLVPSSTSHLTSSHLHYFSHWSYLLLLESSNNAAIKAFWTEDAVHREMQNLCFSWVCLDKKLPTYLDASAALFVHTFVRSEGCPVPFEFKTSGLKEGDYVAISNQKNHDEVAIAMGYILKISEHSVQVTIERDLKTLVRYKDCIFRIDKQISNSANSLIRNNLMVLMANETQADKLRNLIIDKKDPTFLQSLPKKIVLLGREILKTLNKIQQKVILKALMAEDYFLIKGMPGTGKTSTIVALTRLLVKMGVSVLLTSYTHSAIDNILLKLKEHCDFVRLGPWARLHTDVRKYSFENLTKDFTSAIQFSDFMKKNMVVAVTCLGINHVMFDTRKFDVCIVDEASQLNQIACLGPLFYAKKFILVGDDKQLPPLVLNKRARLKGMQESLFQRLENENSCMKLNIQYRMNKEIMRLCNELTYGGALECGSEEILESVLKLNFKSVKCSPPAWVLSVLEPSIQKSVIFLNTDNLTADSSDSKNVGENDIEANLIITIMKFLLMYTVPTSHIGIIAPYRRQVDLIEDKLKYEIISNVEVNTVDQYQGRDKEVIIISCVRNSKPLQDTEKTGIILDDERRLNVAISRAKHKLILVGSKRTLAQYRPFEKLFLLFRNDQFIDLSSTELVL